METNEVNEAIELSVQELSNVAGGGAIADSPKPTPEYPGGDYGIDDVEDALNQYKQDVVNQYKQIKTLPAWEQGMTSD